MNVCCLALLTALVLLTSSTAFQLPQKLPQTLQTVLSLHGRAVFSEQRVRPRTAAYFSQAPRSSSSIAKAYFSQAPWSSSRIAMASSTKYDVVVYGATSFAGQLTCEYYLTTYGASPPTFKWAIAAR